MSLDPHPPEFLLRMIGRPVWVGIALLLAGSGAVRAQALAERGLIRVDAAELRAEAQKLPPAQRATSFGQVAPLKSLAADWVMRRSLAEDARQAGLEQDAEVQRQLALARERVLAEAMLAKLDQELSGPDAAVEAYARASYQAQIKRFERPEQLRLRHILLREVNEANRQKLQGWADQVRQGADFAALAQAHSADPGSAAKGGDLGPTPRGKMVKPFEEAAFALKRPLELSEVVETQFGLHLIQLVERQPAGITPFIEIKEGLMADARNQLIRQGRQRLQERLMRDISFHEAALEALARESR